MCIVMRMVLYILVFKGNLFFFSITELIYSFLKELVDLARMYC